MSCSRPISAEQTVNEVIRTSPSALSVITAYGIDICCGGDRPLAEVATRHGIDLEKLISELSGSSCACGH